MSTKVGFYHLLLWPLEKALPVLVGKALDGGHRVMVMAGSEERVADLDALLWTFDPASWLPHGTRRDGDAPRQPCFLSERAENANGADILILTDGVDPGPLNGYARCLNLFDGNDAQALDKARRLWAELRRQGYELTYYQQTERGGWEEKARTDPSPAT